MKVKSWLVLVPAVVAVVPFAGGCGQDVATCATVCGLRDAPQGCLNSCDATEAACTPAVCGGDFQAYLTCLENAGTYSAVDGLCASIASAVATDTGTRVQPPSDAGADTSAGRDSAVNVCSSATCAEVCTNSGAASSCTAGCEMTSATCSSAAPEFQAFLSCLCMAGGITQSPNPPYATECAAQIAMLAEACPGLSVGQPMPGGGIGGGG